MARDPACIFCRIIAGEIPSLKVYEDGVTFSFLDIGPLADGHLLVVPKDHYDRLDAMPAALVGAVSANLGRLAQAVMAATGAGAYNVLLNVGRPAGQEVPHVHYHIIPRIPGDGLGYRWAARQYAPGRGEEIAGRVRSALGSGN